MIELETLLQAVKRRGAAVVGACFAREFVAFSHDSRTVAPGELFVALRTEKADGHDFIGDAVSRGASGVLCERPPATLPGTANATVVRVDDTRAALLDWAAFILDLLHPYRMAVAGAVGKTSARATIARALGAPGDPGVFSNGNRNDELGLPLALGELRREHGVAVLEIAGDSAAELQRLGALLRPDALVLTGAAPPDAEDPAGVALRGAVDGLLRALAPGGLLVVNDDDPHLARLLDGQLPAGARLRRYGLAAGCDVNGTVLEQGARETLLEIGHGEASARVHLRAPGDGYVHAALAATTVALELGIELDEVAARLDGLPPEPGRLAPLAGHGGSTVLDDSFNASPASLALALATLGRLPRPHAAVLGEISGLRHIGALDEASLEQLLALDRLVLQGRELAALGRELRARSRHPERIVLTFSHRDSADAVLDLTPRPPLLGTHDHGEGELPSGRVQNTNSAEPPSPSVMERVAARPARPGEVRPGEVPSPDLQHNVAPETPLHRDGEGWRSRGEARAGTILVKGSDAARMERVVALLLPEGQQAALVRQDEGWRRRTYVPNERPTWVEVDLEAIRANLRALQAAAAPAQLMAVLKADAYGHGARWVARTAALNGAAMLGVASLNEALDLRADGILTPILILGYAPPWQARDLARSDIRATVFSLPVVQHFSRVAADLGRCIRLHIKVDTGMTRLGVLPDDVPAFVDAVAALPGVELEGIFSHMATSDSDVGFAIEQGERFQAVLAALDGAGRRFRYVHMENSAAILRRLPFAGNLVRAGMALYGLYSLPPEETDVPLRPALAFKTRIAQVKLVPAGTGVSYGRTFVTTRPSRIAILPVGYGDGFRRSPANWGHVLVHGRRAPIAGVVAMDMTMIDVTEIEGVREGDEVVLIGRQGEEVISVEDVAAALGTIPYEVITQILPRVPRQTG
jgi:alanine racemase